MKMKNIYHELNVMKENFYFKMKRIKIRIKSMFNLHKSGGNYPLKSNKNINEKEAIKTHNEKLIKIHNNLCFVNKNNNNFKKSDDNLIRKLKEQREERVINRKKTFEKKDTNKFRVFNNKLQRSHSHQESHSTVNSFIEDESRIKEERRKFILNRIEERNKYAEMRKEANKRSDLLIRELMNKGGKNCQEEDLLDMRLKEKFYSQNIIESYNNKKPISKTDEIKNDQRQKELYTNSTEKKSKRYQPGHFLIQLFEEDERKKSQEKLKFLERRRVILKHKEYSEKLRSRTRATSSTYLTEVLNE